MVRVESNLTSEKGDVMMGGKKLFVWFACLILAAPALFAATTGKISGTVTDAQTGEVLPGANILLEGTKLGAAADFDGYYYILNVPPGDYSVTATMMGYTTITKQLVRVKTDHTRELNFALEQTAIVGEAVVVVAERPLVELDLTASKEVISAEDLATSFVTNVEQAVNTQQGVNYNAGIRGGFGLDVAYLIDGQEMRDPGSGDNYTGFNISSIEELQVLTGGFNAEYGRSMGSIVNVVTKRVADRFHGTVKYQFRPAGKYHWGPYMYDESLYEYRVMSTPEYWDGVSLGEYYADNNYTDEQELEAFRNQFLNNPVAQMMKDYDKRVQHEYEATLYGPITNKLSVMMSGRYKKSVPNFPTPLKYNPEWHGEAKLEYDLSMSSKLRFKVMFGGVDNTGFGKSIYGSSETLGQLALYRQFGRFIDSGTMSYKYFPVQDCAKRGGIKPPEYLRTKGAQIKFTHTFNPVTFLEAKIDYLSYRRDCNYLKDDLAFKHGYSSMAMYYGQSFFPKYKLVPPELQFSTGSTLFQPPTYFADMWQEYLFTEGTSASVDLTSQVTDVHQIKSGAFFSYQFYDAYRIFGQYSNRDYCDNFLPVACHPYEGAAYIQDRIETKGMIINLGVRMDFYNANKWVSDDIFDPYRLDSNTPGNEMQNYPSIGNPLYGQRRAPDASDQPWVVKTKTHLRLSPRIGISHPITKNTVLHFMYGHFNQRPAWMYIVSNPMTYIRPFPDTVPYTERGFTEEFLDPTTNIFSYYWWMGNGGNPALDFEKVIQFEAGFEQNIIDLLHLDVTMYYKDGKDILSAGFLRDRGSIDYQGTAYQYASGITLMFGDKPSSYGTLQPGRYQIYANRYSHDVRGLEISLDTQFPRYFNVALLYNMSYSLTRAYGMAVLARPGPDGYMQSPDWCYGANNGDRGVQQTDNEMWNPHNSLKINGTFFTPKELGPQLAGIFPLGDVNINFQTTWAQGRRYTYHSVPQGDLSTTPLNRRWKDYWNTNVSINKGFDLAGSTRLIFSASIFNLFNQKLLKLPGWDYTGGSEHWIQRYHEEGILPYVEMGRAGFKEQVPLEWEWYEMKQLPREIIFGVTLEM